MTGGVEEYAERFGRILQEGWSAASPEGQHSRGETTPIQLNIMRCIFDANLL
jgi:hypothetical protein